MKEKYSRILSNHKENPNIEALVSPNYSKCVAAFKNSIDRVLLCVSKKKEFYQKYFIRSGNGKLSTPTMLSQNLHMCRVADEIGNKTDDHHYVNTQIRIYNHCRVLCELLRIIKCKEINNGERHNTESFETVNQKKPPSISRVNTFVLRIEPRQNIISSEYKLIFKHKACPIGLFPIVIENWIKLHDTLSAALDPTLGNNLPFGKKLSFPLNRYPLCQVCILLKHHLILSSRILSEYDQVQNAIISERNALYSPKFNEEIFAVHIWKPPGNTSCCSIVYKCEIHTAFTEDCGIKPNIKAQQCLYVFHHTAAKSWRRENTIDISARKFYSHLAEVIASNDKNDDQEVCRKLPSFPENSIQEDSSLPLSALTGN